MSGFKFDLMDAAVPLPGARDPEIPIMRDLKEMVIDIQNTRKKAIDLQFQINCINDRLNDIHTENISLKHLIEDFCDPHQNKIKIPHRCPVCAGSTFDDDGSLCLPCDGRGIVWG